MVEGWTTVGDVQYEQGLIRLTPSAANKRGIIYNNEVHQICILS